MVLQAPPSHSTKRLPVAENYHHQARTSKLCVSFGEGLAACGCSVYLMNVACVIDLCL